MRRLRATRLGRVHLAGKSLLFGPLSLKHVLCGFSRGIELSFSLSLDDGLQRLGVGALPLGRQVLRSSFELLRGTVLDEMTADAAFLAHITRWGMAQPSYAQSYSRAVLDVVAGDAAPSTYIVSWGYAAPFLARHGTHLGGCQSGTVGVSGVVVRVDA